MNNSKIAVRYAKALFLTASEREIVDVVGEDIRRITALMVESPDFIIFLQSSAIKKSKKVELFRQILEPHVHELTLRFVLLVAENRREIYLPDICRDYIQIMREKMNIMPVVVTTAVGLSPEVLDSIRKDLGSKTGKTIELTEKVKPEIIGGLVLRLGDLQFDGSVANQLRKVKEELLRSELI